MSPTEKEAAVKHATETLNRHRARTIDAMVDCGPVTTVILSHMINTAYLLGVGDGALGVKAELSK